MTKLIPLATNNDVAERIMAACADRTNSEPRRNYLGMSGIGHPCSRKLWIDYHGMTKAEFDGQTSRRFAMGHCREEVIINDLRLAGYRVEGQQIEFSDYEDRLLGHCDGIIHGVTKKPHILEIKTANDANFKHFESKGIGFKPEYAAQVQLYMHFSALDRALFLVENKNNQKLYAERVYYDSAEAGRLREKAYRLIHSKDCPEKPESTSSCFFCPWRNNMCETPPINKFDAKTCLGCDHHVTKDVLPQAVDILIKDIKKSVLADELGLELRKDITALVRSIEDLHPEFMVDNRLLKVNGGEDLLKLLDFILKKYASWVDLPTGDPNSPIEIQGLTFNSLKHIMYRLNPAEHEYCKRHDNKMIKRPVGCADRKC